MAGYVNSGAVDTDVDVDTSRLKGQTALVTGGIFYAGSHRSFAPC